MKKKKIPPVHPGEILFEEFLKAMNISQNQLSRNLGVSPRWINEIVHCSRSAERLHLKYFRFLLRNFLYLKSISLLKV